MYINTDLENSFSTLHLAKRARNITHRICAVGVFLVVPLLALPSLVNAEGSGKYGFGVTPTPEEIAEIDIDAMPDGRGLPDASGDYQTGETVYTSKCSSCHGPDLGGVKETGGAALIGGRGSLTSGSPKKTIESYWPYASTVFDYVKRAMPFNAPGSLTDQEVYSVVAYILAEASIIEKDQTMDATSLPAVEMPNQDGFIADPRPDIFNYD